MLLYPYTPRESHPVNLLAFTPPHPPPNGAKSFRKGKYSIVPSTLYMRPSNNRRTSQRAGLAAVNDAPRGMQNVHFQVQAFVIAHFCCDEYASVWCVIPFVLDVENE